jgi:DNA-binding response OmpR family regulator
MVDIIMPEINGLELANRIQAMRPALPVLYFSAYSDQETLRPVIARGIQYIAKPFTSIQLTKRIREVLDNSKGAAAEAETPQ